MLCWTSFKPNPRATSSRKPSLRAELGGLFWASWLAALLPGCSPPHWDALWPTGTRFSCIACAQKALGGWLHYITWLRVFTLEDKAETLQAEGTTHSLRVSMRGRAPCSFLIPVRVFSSRASCFCDIGDVRTARCLS